jgi:porin
MKHNSVVAVVAVLIFGALRCFCAAEEAAKPGREWPGSGLAWQEWSRLTGDWAGGRATLEDKGLSFEFTHTLDWSGTAHGALNGRATERGLFDLKAIFSPPLNRGTTLTVEYLAFHGRDASADVGSLVTYSNIDTPPFSQWGELALEHLAFNGDLRLKLGQFDANSEFALPQAGLEFLNSAAAYSPTITTMRTYPAPALGVAGFAQTGRVFASAGIFGGTVRQALGLGHPLLIGEVGLTGEHDARALVGVWHDGAVVTRFDGTTQHGTSGFYALAERRIWAKNPADKDDARGISIFAQFGSTSDAVSSMRRHAGLGLSATGLVPGREADICGVYGSVVTLSREDITLTATNETALEVYYGAALTKFLTLKADVQLIRHPGGDITRRDVVVGTLRMVTTF